MNKLNKNFEIFRNEEIYYVIAKLLIKSLNRFSSIKLTNEFK